MHAAAATARPELAVWKADGATRRVNKLLNAWFTVGTTHGAIT